MLPNFKIVQQFLLIIEGHFIYSREGLTQGDPMEIIADTIVTLPLIKNLKQ